MMEGKGRGELGNVGEGQEGGGCSFTRRQTMGAIKLFLSVVSYYTKAWPWCVHVFCLRLVGSA